MLRDKLNAMSAASAEKIPPEILSKMMHAKEALGNTDILQRAIKAGEIFPTFDLADANGNQVGSQELLQKGPMLITLFRGVWWPYCCAELEALQEILPEINKTGASLIAISPMLVKYAPQLVHKLNLGFPILSDSGQLFLEQLRVIFSLPGELIEIYKGFGIDLERFNGEKIWRLPLPGQIIVGRDGVVRNVDLYIDHTQRPEPTEVLKLLKAL